MRNILILVIILSLNLTSKGKAQEKIDINQIKISIAANRKQLKNILSEIEKKANIIFSYNSKKINADSLVSINISNGKLEDVLKQLFAKNISYQISSNNVILFPNIRKQTKSIESPKPKTLDNIIETSRDIPLRKDTILIYKRDTVIVKKVDTLKIIVRDTIITKKYIYNTPEKKKEEKPVYYVGIFYQFLKTSSTYLHFGSDDDDLKVEKIIKSSEKIESSFRGGFLISFFSRNLIFGSGISFLRINENYSYPNRIDTIFKFDNQLNDTINTIVGKNRYNWLSIPLSIGYSYKINKKFSIDYTISVWINYLISTNGKSFDLGKKKPFYFTEIDKSNLQKFGIDFSLGISLGFDLTNKIKFQISPSYNIQIGSDYVNDYPITKNKKSIGINFSLLRKF